MLEVVPCSIRRARRLVDEHHRHHKAPQGALFAIGLAQDGELVGAAIVGRPVARRGDDGFTAEVTRVVVPEGVPNACSMLYGAARRAAKALGYRRMWTYTLASEPGTSLRAAGWRLAAKSRGGPWSRENRLRHDLGPLTPKVRWEAPLATVDGGER